MTASAFRCGRIAIAGKPNVGKSSLLNRLVGAKLNIATPRPQTTRDNVLGLLTQDDCQYIFIDSPGYEQQQGGRLAQWMRRRAQEAWDGADLALLVVDCQRSNAEDAAIARRIPPALPLWLLLNKVDRLRDKQRLLPLIAELREWREFAGVHPVSARTGLGLPQLLRELRPRLPEQAAFYPEDDLTDRSERFLAAELLREQLFKQLGDELPYGLAVVIDEFVEEAAGRRISASIVVSKANHKPIVIGAGGAKLKAIGTKARLDMQRLFGTPVFLTTWVKVRPGWQDNESMLRDLVYAR